MTNGSLALRCLLELHSISDTHTLFFLKSLSKFQDIVQEAKVSLFVPDAIGLVSEIVLHRFWKKWMSKA